MASIQDSILQAVDTLVANRVSQIVTDQTVIATIVGCNNALTREYYVTYNGGKMKAYAQEGASYSTGQSVYVLVPQGDFTNEKTIVSVVQNGSDDYNISFVSSALASYNLIGSNCFDNKSGLISNNGLGLCSYKKEDYKVLYQRNPDPDIYKDAKFLGINLTELENNLKEAEAILIEASFKTSLPRVHRVGSTGTYGLAFTLAFKDGDKVDDEGNAAVKYLEYVIDSNSMTGSPFNYTVFFEQNKIFPIDLENFLYIENVFFYSKDFVEETDKVKSQSKADGGVGNNIFVRDIEFYGLKKISATNGDYSMKLGAPDGVTFYTTAALEKLSVTATYMYQNSNLSDDVVFYWFKEDGRVTSSSTDYHMYGGAGWSFLKTKGNSYNLEIYGSENKSYENKYMCVGVYKEEVVLKDYVIFYNEAAKREITIESNYGTSFSFDRGVPTLTCLVNGKSSGFEKDEKNGRSDNWYTFVWSKVDSYGQVTTFQETATELQAQYDQLLQSQDFSYTELSALKSRITALADVSWDKNQFTYPVSSVDGSATFSCSVYLRDSATSTDYLGGVAQITLTNETAVAASGYYIQIENGDQVFQYSESGVTPTSDRLTDPLKVKPLKCHFYDPAGFEVNSKTYELKWRVPLENTLVVTPSKDMHLNEVSGKIEWCTQTEFPLDIKDEYDYSSQNNQVRAIVTYKDKEFWQDSDLLFTKVGENGTNGTDIVAKIVPTSTKLKDENLALLINADGQSGKKEVSYAYKFNTGQNLNDKVLSFELYNRNNLVDSKSLTNVSWTVSGGDATKTSKSTDGKVIKKVGKRLSCDDGKITWYYDKDSHYFKNDSRPSYVEGKSQSYQTAEQKSNIYNYSISSEDAGAGIKCRRLRNQIVRGNGKYKLSDNNTYDYYAFYPLNVIEYKYSKTYLKEFHGLDVYLPKSENLTSVTYNADGRNPLYDKNKGVTLGFKEVSGIDDPAERAKNYWFEWFAEGGEPTMVETVLPTKTVVGAKTNQDKAESTKFQVYNENPTNAVFSLYTDKDLKTSLENGQRIQGLTQVWIKPNDVYSGEYANNLVHCRIYSDKNATEQLVDIYVPIYFSLNTYGLKSLNSWDGNHIEINEDDNYILAPQIGAGEKDDDNKFTGVVMGTAKTYDQSESSVGLLGYSHGKQSIYLDAETGNATFGLPENSASANNKYTEGRIELVPGGTSKIGMWNIGSRAIYNMTEAPYVEKYELDANGKLKMNENGEPVLSTNPTSDTKYVFKIYNKDRNTAIWSNDTSEIFSPDALSEVAPTTPAWSEYEQSSTYNVANASISTPPNAQGVIISANPAYLSLKSVPLTRNNTSIEWSGTNTMIKEGDSIEVELDPSKASVFSIYRHTPIKNSNNSNSGKWKRYPLVGINQYGQFYSNAVEDGESSMGIGKVGAFGDSASEEKYVGMTFGWKTSNLLKFFVEIDEKDTNGKSVSDANKKLYLTTGTKNEDEYPRPIGVYGKEIGLYAYNTKDKKSSDSPHRIIIDKSSAFFGHDEDNANYLKIPNGNSSTAELKVTNNLEITSASSGTSKLSTTGALTLESANKSLNINSKDSMSLISSGGDIVIKANKLFNIQSSAFKLQAKEDELVIGRILLGKDESGNDKFATKEDVYLSLNGSTGEDVLKGNSLSLQARNGKVNITSEKTTEGITLTANMEKGSYAKLKLMPSGTAGKSTFELSSGCGSIVSKDGGSYVYKHPATSNLTNYNGLLQRHININSTGLSANWGVFRDTMYTTGSSAISVWAKQDIISVTGHVYAQDFNFIEGGVEDTHQLGGTWTYKTTYDTAGKAVSWTINKNSNLTSILDRIFTELDALSKHTHSYDKTTSVSTSYPQQASVVTGISGGGGTPTIEKTTYVSENTTIGTTEANTLSDALSGKTLTVKAAPKVIPASFTFSSISGASVSGHTSVPTEVKASPNNTSVQTSKPSY
jgi:hypothetical protein